jgi:hypothetical protein
MFLPWFWLNSYLKIKIFSKDAKFYLIESINSLLSLSKSLFKVVFNGIYKFLLSEEFILLGEFKNPLKLISLNLGNELFVIWSL